MNIKHIVYTFFFVALMGVILEKSEAITVINTSDTTFFVECKVEHYNHNGEKIKEFVEEFEVLPGEAVHTPMNPGFNIVRVTLEIYRIINNEWKLVLTSQVRTGNDNEIMDIAPAALLDGSYFS